MRPPLIWSRRGAGCRTNRELFSSGGGVDNAIRDEDGDGGIARWACRFLGVCEVGEQGKEAQVSELGTGESDMSVSMSVVSRMVEKASKLGLVDDFVRGGVWRLSSAGVGRKNPRGLLSSSSEDSPGVKVPFAEIRVAGL